MSRFTNYFTNFKNFATAQVELSNPLTILIGKNGSGKTNLIEGIEVFAHLAKGTPLHKFSDVGKGGDCQVRGGLDNCIGFGDNDFELRFNFEVAPEFHPRNLITDYKIKVGGTARHESVLSEEHLLVSERPERVPGGIPVFSARHSGGLLKVEYEVLGGDNVSDSVPADRSVLSRYYEKNVPAALVANAEEGVVVVRGVLNYLKTAYIFDINPKAMRDYKRVSGHTELSREGDNLSAVLYALKKNKKSEELERITKIVRQLPEEPFLEIGFMENDEGDVMLGFYVDDGKENKRLLDACMLSDGTLRLLAVLTALETVPEGMRIVVEEFDSGLHPSRARLLVGHLHETAKRRKLKILVTTHNPAVMNALDEKQMESVVLCYRDKETGHSNLTPLMEIQDVDLMMLRGSLGDLVTGEIVEKYLSSEFRDKREEIAQELVKRYSL